MKIALFSDIHANLPALNAVLADIDKKCPDAAYCLGDLVGYNIWPNQVVDTIRRRASRPSPGTTTSASAEPATIAAVRTRKRKRKPTAKFRLPTPTKRLGPTQRQYLRTLPTHVRVEFEMENNPDTLWKQQSPFTLLLVHGSPRKVNEYLFEDRPDRSLGRVLEGAGRTSCALATPISHITKW